MTTIALARQASLGRTTVSKALNGPELMSSETLDALAKAMRMTVEPLHELYDRAEEEQSDPPRPQLREFFDNLIGQHTHLFAGRQAETALITAHIRDRGSGYVFVEAKSGFGKTSSSRTSSTGTPSSTTTSSARRTGAAAASIPPASSTC